MGLIGTNSSVFSLVTCFSGFLSLFMLWVNFRLAVLRKFETFEDFDWILWMWKFFSVFRLKSGLSSILYRLERVPWRFSDRVNLFMKNYSCLLTPKFKFTFFTCSMAICAEGAYIFFSMSCCYFWSFEAFWKIISRASYEDGFSFNLPSTKSFSFISIILSLVRINYQ